jgi:hypothetical protein
MNRIPVGQKDPDIERGFRMHSPAKLRRRALATIAAAALAAPGLLMLTAPTASASVPSSAAFKSSEPFGTWNNGAFDVYNNEWNTSEAGPQTIWAFNYHHWGVESTQSASTSVKTYPSVQRNYPNRPYSTFSMLRSTFAEQMPSSGDFIAEAAYDLWLNNYSIEVMMWFDNHRQVPAGNVIAHVTFGGQNFSVWKSGNDFFSFKLEGGNVQSGTAHLYSALRWLVNHGQLSSSVTLTQVNFGWEICSTHGQPMDFTLTKYTLRSKQH